MKRNLLSILLVLALLITAVPFKASAAVYAQGKSGGDTYWKLYSDGHLYVSGTGELRSKGFSLYGKNKGYWDKYADKIKTVTITNGITSIGEEIFAYCENLTEVTMADTVTEICGKAFFQSTKLTTITLSKSLQTIDRLAFSGTGLTAVVLPDTLTFIGDNAFSGTQIAEITIPAGVTEMGKAVFYKCRQLKSVVFLNMVPWLPEETFRHCDALETVDFPGGMAGFIDSYALADCVSLKSFTVPSGVDSVGERAFSGCTALESVSLPDTLTYIGFGAFENTALTELTIPASVTKIQSGIVSSCNQLVSLTVPSSAFTDVLYYFGGGESFQYAHVTGDRPKHARNYFNEHTDGFVVYYDVDASGWTGHSWGDYPILPWGSSDDVISGTCGENLTWSVENGVLTISGTGPMENFFLASPWEVLDSRIHTVIIEPGVTTIGESAFFKLKNLQSISIPGTVESIGSYAFMECSNLTEVTMEEGLKEIHGWAFKSCTSLKDFHMPDSVTVAVGDVFSDCHSLETVHLSDALTSIPDGIFNNCGALRNFNIPKAATSIGSNAFSGCVSLTEFTVPEQITSIGNYAFQNTGLTEFYVPAWLGSVDSSIFTECVHLRFIHFQGDPPASPFFKDVTATCYYPANNEAWNNFELGNYYGTLTWVPCETVHDVRETEIPATCTEPGSLSTGCACGYGITETELPPLGHAYENEVCTRCGKAQSKLLGDVDGDGALSYNDALTVLRYSISLVELPDPTLADVDGDGTVTYNDALVILRTSIGLE